MVNSIELLDCLQDSLEACNDKLPKAKVHLTPKVAWRGWHS